MRCPVSLIDRGSSSSHPWPVVGLAGWQMVVIGSPDRLSDWPGARRKADFWLRESTLDFLLNNPPGVITEAIVVTEEATGKYVLLTAQTFKFQPGQQDRQTSVSEVSRFNIRKRLLGMFPSKTLVLGQLFTSGSYASDGLRRLSPVEAARLLDAVTKTILHHRGGYRATLIKDADTTGSALERALKELDYQSLETEPVMSMSIDRYTSIDDYLAELTSKYRVRYRRARGKLGDISRRLLAVGEAEQLLPQIYRLYLETSAAADFNLTPLCPAYFGWLIQVGRIDGYFTAEGKLIGFTTGILNGPVYQAHYLGLRDTYKHSHHLYHNMLFDLLADGIIANCKSVDFGRTATEIKSSVGAGPQEYASLVKLCSPLLDRLVPHFSAALFEPTPYVLRNPFRTS